MSNEFVVEAELRNLQGKGASRRLRHEGKIPAILYGDNDAPTNLSLIRKDLAKLLENEAFYSHILTIKYDGKEQAAIMKDLQRHPAKGFVMHADFQRVSKDRTINVNVPLHFINEQACVGVKMEGGVISHLMTDIEITCLPGNLPEYIDVDMLEVKNGTIVHLSDLKLPEGVSITSLGHGSDHDLPVASVNKAKGEVVDEEEGEGEDEA
ncbi:MAG: 50S ribosomal protein L25/general stress protein Ctc [Proteobacteria bacterium]|nr:MAG: 50S ribosomal protein L25/general stress protein Ctc [Pseudomonadota bacterium]